MTNQNSQNNRIVIYCRVSTKEQVEEGTSLVTQEKVCRSYAQSHNYEVVGTYVEEGESAKTSDRTELQKLLAFCCSKKNRISGVLVYKIDRFSRNVHDYSTLRYALKSKGTSIISATENLDETPVGKLMEHTFVGIAQFDNDVRSERTLGGMKEAMREGRWVWKAPLGYSNVREYDKATIAPNSLAPLVAEAFSLIASGAYTTEQVRVIINKKGLNVEKKYFYRVLRNKIYMGTMTQFGETSVGTFKPVVDSITFSKVQNVLSERMKKTLKYKRDNEDFPLRRFVRHPNGTNLTGSWAKKKYAFYRFGQKGLGNFRREEVEKSFKEYMDSYKLKPEVISRLKKFVNEEYKEATKDEQELQKKIKLKLKELETRESTLIDKSSKGLVSDDVLKRHMDRLSEERMNLEGQMPSQEAQNANISDLLAFVEEFLVSPSKVWDEAIMDVKSELQWFQFPSGITFDGKKFETPEVSSVFKAKDLFQTSNSTVVALRGIEPRF